MRSFVGRCFALRLIQLNVGDVHVRSEAPFSCFASFGIFLAVSCIFHINGQRVAMLAQVGLDVFVHVVVGLVFWPAPGEAKIADLGTAFHVDEDVGRLDVAMHDICRVHKIH